MAKEVPATSRPLRVGLHSRGPECPLSPLGLCAENLLPKKKKRGEDEEEEGKGVTHDDVWCLDIATHEVRAAGCGGALVGCGTAGAGCTRDV